MDSLLDFEECVQDSPDFRNFISPKSVSPINQVMKLCGKMVEAGQAYNVANQLFLAGLAEVSTHNEKHSVITSCLKQFNQGLQEMVSFHTVINLSPAGVRPRFLPQLAETRREFVRIGEDLETAAAKNAQVSRHKAGDAERASHLLLATRKCYQHFALDYCLQVRTRTAVSVFSFVHAQFTFFHQGFDLLRDLEPTMKTMAAQVLTPESVLPAVHFLSTLRQRNRIFFNGRVT
uniref:Arf-GAP with coiled-coil, ANK repeat and PH domain-containing protein n=1 Tax=Mola mola TaxID=94237 RepID=A0A3Q3WTX5_MOLML